ncbi:hypothetical protein F5878DRAFT_642855 [Lentinula raphanica]|uniref:Uncharacterized protein n=1 Tax=Lentinula raphanica TaxID=153919 RepID=A0AA38P6N6_9AGAR|nr:hypothetical protein F5878DRAFT_642855 [Lentinula raphanica]
MHHEGCSDRLPRSNLVRQNSLAMIIFCVAGLINQLTKNEQDGPRRKELGTFQFYDGSPKLSKYHKEGIIIHVLLINPIVLGKIRNGLSRDFGNPKGVAFAIGLDDAGNRKDPGIQKANEEEEEESHSNIGTPRNDFGLGRQCRARFCVLNAAGNFEDMKDEKNEKNEKDRRYEG